MSDHSCFQINAEFKRITTMPLQSRFLSQLDVLSDRLVKLFEKRGRQIGKRLQSIMADMSQVRMHFFVWIWLLICTHLIEVRTLTPWLVLLISLDLGWWCWCWAGMHTQGSGCVPQWGSRKSSERIHSEYIRVQ